jgi:hypothetical protein
MKNPFQFGGTLRPEEIVNRQSEIKQIVQTIQDSEKLFLMGLRRYGKTTILHAARQQCEARGGRVIYLRAWNQLPATQKTALSEVRRITPGCLARLAITFRVWVSGQEPDATRAIAAGNATAPGEERWGDAWGVAVGSQKDA